MASTKTIIIIFLLMLLPLSFAQDISDEQMEEAKQKVEQLKAEITAECTDDPYGCSCERIPCDDLLEAEHERKQEVFDRCMEEKQKCEDQRQEGIAEMEELQQEIEEECRENLERCNCNSVRNEEGKRQCELAIIDAKYEAEKEREGKMRQCMEDVDGCDCDSIKDQAGKNECKQELKKAKEMKEKMMNACKENPVACDCDSIESSDGKNECMRKKEEAMKEASGQIKGKLSKCFRDVDSCDCNALGLEEQSYVAFCDTQKTYGLNCKHKGVNCEKLDDVEIYPPGMPAWLGTIFAAEYSQKIQEEKEKASKEAAGIITGCINSPDTCACEKTPTYAQSFCNRMKELQLKCYADDYDACIMLENSPNLPEGMPSFTLGFLDNMINKLREGRAQASKANAARKVGNMILACMDDSSQCDCSFAPAGDIKAFCEHKKTLVIQCRDNKHYDSCFLLDEEPLMPAGVPDSIAGYVDENVRPQVEAKKQVIFDEMKQGTSCKKMATIQESKAKMRGG